jgi:hypothetical protein
MYYSSVLITNEKTGSARNNKMCVSQFEIARMVDAIPLQENPKQSPFMPNFQFSILYSLYLQMEI